MSKYEDDDDNIIPEQWQHTRSGSLRGSINGHASNDSDISRHNSMDSSDREHRRESFDTKSAPERQWSRDRELRRTTSSTSREKRLEHCPSESKASTRIDFKGSRHNSKDSRDSLNTTDRRMSKDLELRHTASSISGNRRIEQSTSESSDKKVKILTENKPEIRKQGDSGDEELGRIREDGRASRVSGNEELGHDNGKIKLNATVSRLSQTSNQTDKNVGYSCKDLFGALSCF